MINSKIFHVWKELQGKRPFELVEEVCQNLICGKRVVLVLDYVKPQFVFDLLEELRRKEQDLSKLSFWGTKDVVVPVLKRYNEMLEQDQ